MQPTKQPLIIEEGKDCKYEDISDELTCIRGNLIATDYAIGLKGNTNLSQFKIDDCPKCKEGKSPTKLIFDADDFQEEYYDHEIDYEHESSRIAKRYLLSKKGELRCGNCVHGIGTSKSFSRMVHQSSGLLAMECFCGCKEPKPFRLSSDAVLKNIKDILLELPNDLCFKLFDNAVRNNMSKSSKVVIAEGYYE
mgnify:CR=1 FL=1